MTPKTPKLTYELKPYAYMLIGLILLLIPSDIFQLGLSHIVWKVCGGLLIAYGIIIQQKRGRFRSKKRREAMKEKLIVTDVHEKKKEERSKRNIR